MPFKSKKQWRKFFAMEAKGSTSAWERHKGLDAFLFPPEEAVRKISFPETRELLKKVLARMERDEERDRPSRCL